MTFSIDFTVGKLANRQRQGISFREPLARALGIKPNKSLNIIDATAGLGRDAFIMASLGCQVTLLERSPIVFEALKKAIFEAQQNPALTAIADRMHLQHRDSIGYLKNLVGEEICLANKTVDAIYLDPMYSATQKSALVKKEMRDLREIVGDDLDVENLFQATIKASTKRVVVKRHRHAPPIAGSQPTHAILTKLLRFDVYLFPPQFSLPPAISQGPFEK